MNCVSARSRFCQWAARGRPGHTFICCSRSLDAIETDVSFKPSTNSGSQACICLDNSWTVHDYLLLRIKLNYPHSSPGNVSALRWKVSLHHGKLDRLENHPSSQGLTGIKASIVNGWTCKSGTNSPIFVLWVESFLLKIHVLTPSTSECGLIWKESHRNGGNNEAKVLRQDFKESLGINCWYFLWKVLGFPEMNNQVVCWKSKAILLNTTEWWNCANVDSEGWFVPVLLTVWGWGEMVSILDA